MAADKLRVGIIGTGWGVIVHAPAFGLVDEYEVAALCSRREERLAQAMESTGITDGSTDWEAFVRRDDLDIISVAAPVELHRDITLAAIAAGKHVLCEKPAALTAKDAREMAEAAEKAGVASAICFELRWTPIRLAVWEQVLAGLLGDRYFMRLAQSHGYWHPSRPAKQSRWMYKRDEGGGYLYGMVSHDIDFARALLGEPVQVAADVRTTVDRRTAPDGEEFEVTADDTCVLLLRFDTGAFAELSASVMGVHVSGWRLELFGSDGTALATGGRKAPQEIQVGTVEDEGLRPVELSSREPRSGRRPPERGAAEMIRAQALMLEDWVPAFSGGATRVPTLRDGWRVQQVMEAALESAAGGGWIDLDQ